MVSDNFGPDDYGGSNFSRFIRKCNNFRSTPAAVLAVSTMAVFADTMVYGLIVPFLPEILQERLHMSSSTNGVLFGCFGIGVLVGAPISAYISDRWKLRKWPMIIGLLGLGATSVLFAFSNAFWELVVARLAQGVSSGITWAVGLGMIADVYAGEAIGQAMGVAFSGFTLGYLGGPVLGGVIYGAGGTHAIAIFVGAIAAVDLVCRLLLKEPHEAEQGDDDKKTDRFSVDKCKSADPSKNRRTTMLDLLKEWPILACCLATITVTGASGAFEPTLPIHLAEKYNSSSTVIGVVFIALVIPNAVIAPFAGKYTDDSRVLAKLAPYGRFGFMIIGSILEAIAIACIGATTNIAGIVVNLVFVGLLGGIAAVPVMSAMGIHVHRMGGDAYAKVYALFNIAYSIGVIIIPTVLPPIMNAVGFAATMGVTAAILVFGAIILAIQPTLMLIKHGRAAYLGENGRVFL
ncbi:major facilitator superfamily domain-containing protein [Coemansia spiralis]|nr:major facilitator superfamily domain-containing protein [Coemansia spiralis]